MELRAGPPMASSCSSCSEHAARRRNVGNLKNRMQNMSPIESTNIYGEFRSVQRDPFGKTMPASRCGITYIALLSLQWRDASENVRASCMWEHVIYVCIWGAKTANLKHVETDLVLLRGRQCNRYLNQQITILPGRISFSYEFFFDPEKRKIGHSTHEFTNHNVAEADLAPHPEKRTIGTRRIN